MRLLHSTHPFTHATSLYKRYGTEIAVVTLQALPTRNSEEYRAFATRLFNAWGVGNAARDTGVLLLLVRDNRRFEVVTGSGLSTVVPSAWLYDFQTRELEAPLVGGDYSKVRAARVLCARLMSSRLQALAKTVVAIAEKIEEHESNWRSNQAKVRVAWRDVTVTSSQLQAAKKEVVPQEQRSVFAMLGQLGVLLSLFAGYLYWSWREEDKADETHKCSFCGGEVERDTSRILSYTDAQALEVALGAATYEAGKCSGCRRTQNIRRLAFRRGAVQRCDYCRNHTAIESESFVVDEKAQVRALPVLGQVSVSVCLCHLSLRRNARECCVRTASTRRAPSLRSPRSPSRLSRRTQKLLPRSDPYR